MTFPITPDPNVHTQPAGIRQQKSLYTGGQLATWTQQLPQAMTAQLCIAILEAIGVPPGEAEQLVAQVQSELATWNTISNNAHAWATRLTNDLTILLDVFHGTYQAGSTGDAPGTLGTNGKPTWYSAWNDLLALLGIVNSTSTPSNPAPTIGTAITTAQTTASTASTNASTALTNAAMANSNATTAQSWGTRLTNDLLILSDVFHLTYQAGSTTDAPGTLGTNGKPTWYSAWNDLLALCGVVNSTTAPTDSAPTTGTVIQSNTAAANTAGTNASTALANAATANTLAQGTIDGLNQAWSAGGTGNPVSSVATIADAIPGSAVVGTTGAAVGFGAVGGGNSTNGTGVTSLTTSWTHTIATGDLGVLVFIAYSTGSGTNSSSATYGGSAMTLLKSMKASTGVVGAYASMDVYWLKSPPSGSQTVSVTANCSGNVTGLYGNSASYSGSKVGTVGFASGGGSTGLSMSAASTTGHMVVGGFSSYVNNNNTLSSFSQTSRYNKGFTTVGLAEVFGDAAGASSVSFTATSPYSTQQWVGVTVELTN